MKPSFFPLLLAALAPLTAVGEPTLKVYPEHLRFPAPGRAQSLIAVMEDAGIATALPSRLGPNPR
ncbi:MAG: hypothetical protein RLZZ253_2640 [Verrucomicrobiota bacterium]